MIRYRVNGDDRYQLATVLYPTTIALSVAVAFGRAYPGLATKTLYREDGKPLVVERFYHDLRG